MRNISPKRLVEVLSEPKTLAQMSRVVQTPASVSLVRSLELPEGYSLFEQENAKGDPIFLAVQQKKAPEKRLWSLWEAPKSQPYVWIQFPKTYKNSRIQIVPLSDVHYGAKAHNNKRFLEYLKWIADHDDVFTFLNGDLIENAIEGSIGGAIYDSIMNPDTQIWGDDKEPGIIELLRPIAHKILFAQPGNHEMRTWKKTNIDPLKIICRDLLIPYFNEPIYADILAWGHRFTFFCHHGTTSSNTKGGKLNAAGKPAEFQEAVDFIISGHVHDSMSNPATRIVRRRKYDNCGRVTGFFVEEVSQYVVICPSFYSYFNSYASRSGYAPGSWGSVNCTLFQDGSYRAGE